MPDTVKSLRKSNNDFKRQLEAAKRDFKKLEDRFQAHEAVRCEEDQNGGASCSLNVEVEKSLDFLGKEYDDLSNSDADTKRELCRIGTKLDEIGVRLEEMAGILDEMQEYSYSFNVKLLGVPQLSADENAVQTSNLCVKIFNKMGANVSINDLDIAHRVSTRSVTREGPKPIVCKFTRRLARNEVMSLRKEACKINPEEIGLPQAEEMTNVRLVDHLTPRLQLLYADAKDFKSRYNFEFCWAKNATIFLRRSTNDRALKIRSSSDLTKLEQQEQSMLT